jgi:chromosome segregation ATPase
MKFNLAKTLLISCCIFNANSAFSFGGVVTDPTSYTYYVKQLEEAKKQLETAQESLDTITETKDGIFSIKSNVEGNLQRAQRSISRIKSLEDNIKDNPEDALNYASDALDDVSKIDKYRENVANNVEKQFGTLNDKVSDWGDVKTQKEIQAAKQEAAKKAIINAEVAKGKIAQQLEDLSSLANDANSATSLKDASDVNNAILLKMNENLVEIIALISDISQNISLAYYNGKENVDKEPAHMKDGKSMLNADDWKPTKTQKVKSLTERGCNPFSGECDKGAW